MKIATVKLIVKYRAVRIVLQLQCLTLATLKRTVLLTDILRQLTEDFKENI